MSNEHLDPHLTGKDAEDFVEYFSRKTFLSSWVFRSPKFAEDNKEFADIAVVFRDIIILIEVKGNKFDPNNPQRYIKEAKYRHQQLLNAERMVLNKTKTVIFKNEFFSFEIKFENIKKVYLISVSTGLGEMELAAGSDNIDYSKINHEEVTRYLGFFDSETNIHSFTADEIVFASKHIDTLKDFFWYLDFEKKYLSSDFKSKAEQNIIAVVDAHREDLISIYILNYYWDEELNKTGNINLNKIFGDANIEKADMVLYAGADTRKYLEEDETYKKIQSEKKISYFWDNLIGYVFTQYSYAYKLTADSRERQKINLEDIKGVIEGMSFTSRFERVLFSERIRESEDKKINFRNMFSLADDSDTLFSYLKTEYDKFPTPEEQENRGLQHLYRAWCRITFGEKYKPYRDKIKKVLLITKHHYKDNTSISFSLSSGIRVDENICKEHGMI